VGSAQRPVPSPRVTAACRFNVDDKGGFVWLLHHGNHYVLRANPPALLRRGSDARAWRRSLHLPFELSAILRELQHDDDVAAGRRTLTSIPDDERPVRRAYRMHRRDAMRRFFAAVPGRVQQALHGFGSGSFPLFRFLMTTPAALDLMDSDDGARLAWCLANAHELSTGMPSRNLLRRARGQVRRRRRDALGFIALPTTSAALHGLARVPRADLGRDRIADLRRVLSLPELHDRARHLPVWNHALELLTPELHRHVHTSFLYELAAEPVPSRLESSVAHEVRETLAMLAQHGAKPPVFRSRAHLREVHDDTLQRLSPLSTWWSPTPFPPSPLALSDRERAFVQPLVDSGALVREGKQMHHCLGSVPGHHALARLGLFVALTMTKPSRLTLAFSWSARLGDWILYDLRGPANQHAPAAAGALAEDLLTRLRRSGIPPVLLDPARADDVRRAQRVADHDLGGGDDDPYDFDPYAHVHDATPGPDEDFFDELPF
jgi:hypothetical protein